MNLKILFYSNYVVILNNIMCIKLYNYIEIINLKTSFCI